MLSNEKIITFLEENSMDAILVASVYNVRYISGFTGDTSYLYISKNRRVLLTDSRYTTWAKSEVKDFEVIEVNAKKNYSYMINEFVGIDKVKKIGFENHNMLYCDVIKFQKACKEAEFIELDGKLDKFRQIKSDDEISKIRIAEKISTDAFEHILNFIKVGRTEQEIALELEIHMRKNGAQGLSFETIAAAGPNSSKPHSVPSDRKIKYGDFVIMDFGCMYEGYCSDMTRTVCIGEPNEKQLKIYNTVLNAQLAALDAIKPKKTGAEVDKIARDIIKEEGFGEYFGHGLGHSVGLFIHEEPRLSPSEKTTLEENMLMTVEPGIYIPGFGGVRIEDLIVVTDDGYENLTNCSKELIVID